MPDATAAVITRMEERPRVGWDDPVQGALSWVTLFDHAITPTAGLTAGIAELAPGQGGRPHRHAQPEIYYMLAGTGTLTIDGATRTVSAGDAIFIPGHRWHCLRNAGEAVVRLLYVFPADGMGDVVYEYQADSGSIADLLATPDAGDIASDPQRLPAPVSRPADFD